MTVPRDPDDLRDQSIGDLLKQLSQETATLVKQEMALARAELTEKGKRAGLGIGMFSAAGLLAFLGLSTLIATAVLVLALVLPPWAAALIVAVLLFAGAGVAALVGKKEVEQATPPAPERTIASVREDVATVKGGHHS